jgi:hypothetical protein
MIYGYSSNGASGSATVTAAGYDADNSVALDRGTTWKGVGTSAQRLILHTGAAIAPTALAIAGGNYSVWGTTVLQHSTDGSSWTTLDTLLGLGSLTDSVQDYYWKISSPTSKSWWCLYWSAPSAAPEVALFYLGTLATMIENYSFPTEERDVYNVDIQQTEGKVIVGEQTARYLMLWVLGWTPTISTVRDQVRAIIQSEGGPLRPFWFVPVDESTSNDYGRAYLVRYQTSTFAIRREFTGIYEFVVTLLEEV